MLAHIQLPENAIVRVERVRVKVVIVEQATRGDYAPEISPSSLATTLSMAIHGLGDRVDVRSLLAIQQREHALELSASDAFLALLDAMRAEADTRGECGNTDVVLELHIPRGREIHISGTRGMRLRNREGRVLASHVGPGDVDIAASGIVVVTAVNAGDVFVHGASGLLLEATNCRNVIVDKLGTEGALLHVVRAQLLTVDGQFGDAQMYARDVDAIELSGDLRSLDTEFDQCGNVVVHDADDDEHALDASCEPTRRNVLDLEKPHDNSMVIDLRESLVESVCEPDGDLSSGVIDQPEGGADYSQTRDDETHITTNAYLHKGLPLALLLAETAANRGIDPVQVHHDERVASALAERLRSDVFDVAESRPLYLLATYAKRVDELFRDAGTRGEIERDTMASRHDVEQSRWRAVESAYFDDTANIDERASATQETGVLNAISLETLRMGIEKSLQRLGLAELLAPAFSYTFPERIALLSQRTEEIEPVDMRIVRGLGMIALCYAADGIYQPEYKVSPKERITLLFGNTSRSVRDTILRTIDAGREALGCAPIAAEELPLDAVFRDARFS